MSRIAREAAKAHPRSRGENSARQPHSRWATGSSPLTRGKRTLRGRSFRCSRLIPAHAGKTCTRSASQGASTAHPRSRGENARSPARARSLPGSSPLTRGKPGRLASNQAVVGLIPAHAGKTFRRKVGYSEWPAHPRSRGENATRRGGVVYGLGSSPLTRGKPSCG